MTNQHNLIGGDHVRVLPGSHTGEIATVGKVIRLSDKSGPYARFHLAYERGKVAYRSMDKDRRVAGDEME